MENWQPSESDKVWLTNMLGMINDGGIWGTSFAIYRLEKEAKTLHEVRDNIPFATDNWDEDRERTRLVAEAIGWKIV